MTNNNLGTNDATISRNANNDIFINIDIIFDAIDKEEIRKKCVGLYNDKIILDEILEKYEISALFRFRTGFLDIINLSFKSKDKLTINSTIKEALKDFESNEKFVCAKFDKNEYIFSYDDDDNHNHFKCLYESTPINSNIKNDCLNLLEIYYKKVYILMKYCFNIDSEEIINVLKNLETRVNYDKLSISKISIDKIKNTKVFDFLLPIRTQLMKNDIDKLVIHEREILTAETLTMIDNAIFNLFGYLNIEKKMNYFTKNKYPGLSYKIFAKGHELENGILFPCNVFITVLYQGFIFFSFEDVTKTTLEDSRIKYCLISNSNRYERITQLFFRKVEFMTLNAVYEELETRNIDDLYIIYAEERLKLFNMVHLNRYRQFIIDKVLHNKFEDAGKSLLEFYHIHKVFPISERISYEFCALMVMKYIEAYYNRFNAYYATQDFFDGLTNYYVSIHKGDIIYIDMVNDRIVKYLSRIGISMVLDKCNNNPEYKLENYHVPFSTKYDKTLIKIQFPEQPTIFALKTLLYKNYQSILVKNKEPFITNCPLIIHNDYIKKQIKKFILNEDIYENLHKIINYTNQNDKDMYIQSSLIRENDSSHRLDVQEYLKILYLIKSLFPNHKIGIDNKKSEVTGYSITFDISIRNKKIKIKLILHHFSNRGEIVIGNVIYTFPIHTIIDNQKRLNSRDKYKEISNMTYCFVKGFSFYISEIMRSLETV